MMLTPKDVASAISQPLQKFEPLVEARDRILAAARDGAVFKFNSMLIDLDGMILNPFEMPSTVMDKWHRQLLDTEEDFENEDFENEDFEND